MLEKSYYKLYRIDEKLSTADGEQIIEYTVGKVFTGLLERNNSVKIEQAKQLESNEKYIFFTAINNGFKLGDKIIRIMPDKSIALVELISEPLFLKAKSTVGQVHFYGDNWTPPAKISGMEKLKK